MLEGTFKLFGLDSCIVALQSWQGPLPSDIEIGVDAPIYQRVDVKTIQPAELVPFLENTPFSKFEYQNVTITHQNYQFVKDIPLGWSIQADFTIDDRHGPLHDIMRNVLNRSGDDLRLSIWVALGQGHCWTSHLQVSTFAAEGALLVQKHGEGRIPDGVKLCNGVALGSIGVLIYGISPLTSNTEGAESINYGFKISGDMYLEVPGSNAPLELDFEIGEFGGVVALEAVMKGNVWRNAFGVGLELDMVQLSTTFGYTAPPNSLEFLFNAHLCTGSVPSLVTGRYSPGGSYSVSSYVQNLGCEGVAALFRYYAGGELSPASHFNITIGSANIKATNSNGLSIVANKFGFGHYNSDRATIELSPKGVQIRGLTDKVVLPGNLGVSLVSACIEVSLEKLGSGRPTEVALVGKVELTGFRLPATSARVQFYRISPSDKLEWAAYGTFTTLGSTATLGQLFPDLGGSYLQDVGLQQLMFTAASVNNPGPSEMNPVQYPIRRGVQFSALLGKVEPLNKLLRRTSFPGLLFNASWQNGNTFALDIIPPVDTFIHLGHGITTDPISLSINLKKGIIQVATGVNLPVKGSTDPLTFKAALAIHAPFVKLSGEMHGLWQNPLGISKNVAIGPFLELGLEVNLFTFFETGIPSGFSLAGGIMIGRTEAQVAAQIGGDLSEELIHGKIKYLDLCDVICFTRQITGLDIPAPPNFLSFEDTELYLCPFGATVGTAIYPPGFSFKSELLIFGARLYASAEVSGGALRVSGSVDNLAIGPLHVTGQHTKQATLRLIIGLTEQRLEVDGAIKFLDNYIALVVHLGILPQPTFFFSFALHFTNWLTFDVKALMIGNIRGLNDLSGMTFLLHSSFKQNLVEYVRSQVIKLLDEARQKALHDIHHAELHVQRERTRFQAEIDNAQNNLNKAHQAWVGHSDKVRADSQAVTDNYTKTLHTLQAKIETERIRFNASLKAAEDAVKQANFDRGAKLREAEANVERARADWNRQVSGAEAELQGAERHVRENFGSAVENIDRAKREVSNIEHELRGTYDRIGHCQNSPWHCFDLKAELIPLGAKVAGLESAKAIAYAALDVARGVVEGTGYISAVAGIPAAKETLKRVRQASDVVLQGAQATVREVDRNTAAVLNRVHHELNTVRNVGDMLIQGAERELQHFIDSQKHVLPHAQRAIEDLITSSEWVTHQAMSTALDVARHSTGTLNIALSALDAAKTMVHGTLSIGMQAITAALGAFYIASIELDASLETFLNGHGGNHFKASVTGALVGGSFEWHLTLDMRDSTKLIYDIYYQ
ncbi:hypothetical protein FRC10_002075 [Ceratobasidium sp. 414]|nr:hypothetical protein FRC10_002075 [Ceratobasidium sp. 414]